MNTSMKWIHIIFKKEGSIFSITISFKIKLIPMKRYTVCVFFKKNLCPVTSAPFLNKFLRNLTFSYLWRYSYLKKWQKIKNSEFRIKGRAVTVEHHEISDQKCSFVLILKRPFWCWIMNFWMAIDSHTFRKSRIAYWYLNDFEFSKHWLCRNEQPAAVKYNHP